MKVKIIQLFVGEDQKYLQLCKEVEKVNRKYAELYNYEYVFEYRSMDVVKESYGACTHREVYIYKNKFMYQHLLKDDCDILVFIDADAAVSKPQIKIEDLIDDQHEIFLSRANERVCQLIHLQNIKKGMDRIFKKPEQLFNEWWETIIARENLYTDLQWMSLGYISANGGFYIIKNTENMKALFKDCMTAQELLVDTIYTAKGEDERALDLCLLKRKYNHLYTFMYDKAQGARASNFEGEYNEDETFILHQYGLATTKDQKIVEVKCLLNNKNWEKIKNDTE